MACFSVFVSDLSSISLSIFDFKLLKSAIRELLPQTAFMGGTQVPGGGGGVTLLLEP